MYTKIYSSLKWCNYIFINWLKLNIKIIYHRQKKDDLNNEEVLNKIEDLIK